MLRTTRNRPGLGSCRRLKLRSPEEGDLTIIYPVQCIKMRLRDHYRMAPALQDGGGDVFFQFPEEDRDLHPEDWLLLEQAWEHQTLDIEIQTDQGLVAGTLEMRFSYDFYRPKKRFEVIGRLLGRLPEEQG